LSKGCASVFDWEAVEKKYIGINGKGSAKVYWKAEALMKHMPI
jgi:hypothetical protein